MGSGRSLFQVKGLPEGEGAEVGSPFLSHGIARTLTSFPAVRPGLLILSGSRGGLQPFPCLLLLCCDCYRVRCVLLPYVFHP